MEARSFILKGASPINWHDRIFKPF